jgi:putative oxidoreductase
MSDIGIVFIRILFGAALAAHGSQKLFGWFGGYGLKGTGGFFETLGFRPGRAFAAAAGLSEFAGGLSLALGLFTPFGAAAVLATMIVAMFSMHLKNGFFAMTNGVELPFLYAVAAAAVALAGPGSLSLDALLGLSFLTEDALVGAVLALAVLGAAATLGLRRTAPPNVTATQS